MFANLIFAVATLTDWASKPLAINPEEFAIDRAGRRDVVWYRHSADPAWGGAKEEVDRFSVVKPVAGDAKEKPLLVVLHWRGAGWPGKGVLMQTKLADEKNRVFSAPDDFYILNLDDIRDYNVLLNRKHDQYWWGATSSYAGPTIADVSRIAKGETVCEKRVLDSIEWTIRRYNINRDRVYLCGNSMGGQATYAIGLGHGEIFAAINANVPATVWFAAARLGFVDDEGRDIRDWNVSRFAEPPVCVEWSGVDDVWSRDREVIIRNLIKRKWSHLVLWGDYGHCGDVLRAREKNDLVERFDWLAIRKNEAYPVFTEASCDDKLPWPFSVWNPSRAWFSGYKGDIVSAKMEIAKGAKKVGQINAFFRWRNIRDDDDKFAMELFVATRDELKTAQFCPPEVAITDVTIRRIQNRELATAKKVRWEFGSQSGVATRDAHGALTIPALAIMQKKQTIFLYRDN